MNKKEFVQRIVSSRSILSELIKQIPENNREQTMISGEMTLKDIVVHITWFELEMLNLLETMTLQGSPLWDLGTDERNARIQAIHAQLPWQQVITTFEKIQPRLMGRIDGLEQAVLETPVYFKHMPDEWIPWEIIAQNTYEHYEHHSMDIKDFLNNFEN